MDRRHFKPRMPPRQRAALQFIVRKGEAATSELARELNITPDAALSRARALKAKRLVVRGDRGYSATRRGAVALARALEPLH